MDSRCIKFWDDGQALLQSAAADAQRLPQTKGKIMKELRTMSRFIQKNQSQRFSDNAQQKIVDAVASYVAFNKQQQHQKQHAAVTPAVADGQQLAEAIFQVVKDGLAMPFNVFGTKQKKLLFKWYNELIAVVAGDHSDGALQIEGLEDAAAGSTAAQPITWSVLDIDADGYLSLLDDESGEVCETFKVDKKSAQCKQIKKALEQAVVIVVTVGDVVQEVKLIEE